MAPLRRGFLFWAWHPSYVRQLVVVVVVQPMRHKRAGRGRSEAFLGAHLDPSPQPLSLCPKATSRLRRCPGSPFATLAVTVLQTVQQRGEAFEPASLLPST